MMRKVSILAGIVLLLFGACKKYEEGPVVSFRTKKERVVNQWKVEEATADDGSDRTDQYDQQVWEFTDDNEFLYKSDTSSGTQEGKWHFENDNEEIFLSGGVFLPHQGEYDILRLKEDELWIKRDSDNEEIHLKPQ